MLSDPFVPLDLVRAAFVAAVVVAPVLAFLERGGR